MPDGASRELLDATHALLARIEAGESVNVFLDGRATAVSAATGHRPRWVDRNEFTANVLSHQAPAGLADDLAELIPLDDPV